MGHPIVRDDAVVASAGSAGTSSPARSGTAGSPPTTSPGGFGPIPLPLTIDDPAATVGGRIPATAYCSPVYTWPIADVVDEESLLLGINLARREGGICGPAAGSNPLPALALSEELRCAARLHSLDMVTTSYFSQTSPNGLTPLDRARLAGYTALKAAEVIASSSGSQPLMVLGTLMLPGGVDCATLVDPSYTAVGIGLKQGIWTIDLAAAN